jgi:hypothetical protein
VDAGATRGRGMKILRSFAELMDPTLAHVWPPVRYLEDERTLRWSVWFHLPRSSPNDETLP